MRYLYIKNGDVIEQLSRIIASGEIDKSGPDAFLADLLANYIKMEPILLLSASHRPKRMKKKNIEAYVFPYRSNNAKAVVAAVLGLMSFLRTVILMLKFRPDRIICGRSGAMLWASFLYAAIFSRLLIHSRHETLIKPRKDGLRRLTDTLDRFCMMKSKAVICHGPYLRDQLMGMGLPPDKVIQFDISFEASAVRNENTFAFVAPSVGPTISYIGRIEKSKGVFDLYQAFKALGAEQTSACVLYVGTGKDLEDLKRRVAEDNLTDRVHFRDPVPHKDVFRIIESSFVVVTPTRSVWEDSNEATEARCMTAMESIFMGVPVVAPDSGPFPYLIKDRHNGLLFKTNDYESLAEALTLALKNPNLYLKLKMGAEQSKNDIETASLSFSGAVDKAFRP
ncbi:glycosyltransferase family 4 protein [Desulfococcus multivorans]|uniref:Glycosyl transferase group 1 n=1 Tax=Desulfococcus multivorans DSM 2059 TaxID=1121405 RepID=S7UPQ0_DESML|nr:glycosyltransferase family 4 protein [Desulfococcus multivorans]AOY60018.1 glycosyltransferase, family I [Desulfococcus multivorans]AQV02159.1 hypothetical protein B2D07_16255 [Desulfococcus multivorans]EPR36014.1 glycosyl transferase group 1 [Desulfococcus multivorans DSM 2059]SJZ36864.1 Glycosyltransferase involved in cell wall bisynthesis [Desulfococcus multivorans DSM 2059]